MVLIIIALSSQNRRWVWWAQGGLLQGNEDWAEIWKTPRRGGGGKGALQATGGAKGLRWLSTEHWKEKENQDSCSPESKAGKGRGVRLRHRQETDGTKPYRPRSLVLLLTEMNSLWRDLSKGAVGSEFVKDGCEILLVASELKGK